MSYQEKRAIVSIISSVLLSALYSAYMVQRYPEGDPFSPDVFRFWGAFFLVLIPVSAVAQVIIFVVFSIINTIATKEGEPSITDERDKLIELKATRNALYVFVSGFLLAMGSLVIGTPPSGMFIILFCAGLGSAVISDISQFYFYRRGY